MRTALGLGGARGAMHCLDMLAWEFGQVSVGALLASVRTASGLQDNVLQEHGLGAMPWPVGFSGRNIDTNLQATIRPNAGADT